MPMPIRPSNSSDSNFSNYFPFNMELFQNDLLTNTSLKKTALANDRDADVLFYIWKNSSVINKEEEIENKIYRVKENVNKEDLLKLKASGLIIGSDKEIRFTNRAANIIKTMVLGEQNSFGKQSVKKPYSIILAEQLKPKRKSALALASKIINVQNNDMLKTSQDYPLSNTPYYFNERVVSKGVASSTSNKEYNVRVYKNKDDEYDLWIFWGRTNGTMQAKKEATYKNLDNAKSRSQDIISDKKYGKNEYKPAKEWGYSSTNTSIPGTYTTDEEHIVPHSIKKTKTPFKPYKSKPIEEKQKGPKFKEPIEEKQKELSESEKEQQRLKSLDEITDAPVDRSRLEELRKTLLGIDEEETTQASNQFNLKKYNAKKKPADVSSEEIITDNPTINEIIKTSPVEKTIKAIIDGKLKLSDIKDPSPELAERLIQERKTAAGIGMRFVDVLLNCKSISPETLEILSNLRKDLETGWGSEILTNDTTKQVLKEVESNLLKRANGEEPWALKIQILNPPEDLNDIKSPILRSKYFDYLSQTQNKQLSKVEKPSTGEQPQWVKEKMELRQKLLEEAEGEEFTPVQLPEFKPTEKGKLGILEQKEQLRRSLLNE